MVSSWFRSALAAWMANWSEPRPESLVLVTTNELTTTAAAAELLVGTGSMVLLEIVAVLSRMVPGTADASTLTVIVKVAVANDARSGSVNVTVPGLPTPGSDSVQPAGQVAPAKVVPAAKESLTTVLIASLGPRFDTLIV